MSKYNYPYREVLTIDGKRFDIKAKTRSELKKKIKAKIDWSRNNPRHIPSSAMPFSQWADRCIDVYKTGQSELTRKKFVSRVNSSLNKYMGNTVLSDITPILCQKVLNYQAGKSKAQINEVHNALKFILDKAASNALIPFNPAQYLEKPKGYKHNRRAITNKERELIISVAKSDRRYYIYLLMLFCGCRPAEACNVKVGDIIKEDGIHLLHIRGTKTDNADRFVPVPDEILALVTDFKDSEYIAINRYGNPITYDNRPRLWHSFKRQLNLAMGAKTYRNKLIEDKVAQDLYPYCLRHTYCTDLARKGIDIRTAQKLMGHSDIKLTANVYTNLDKSDILKAAKLLK